MPFTLALFKFKSPRSWKPRGPFPPIVKLPGVNIEAGNAFRITEDRTAGVRGYRS